MGFWNELGWRPVENIGTEMARYPFSRALCYLKGNPDAQKITLNVFGVPRRVARRYNLEVEVNGQPIDPDKTITPGWQSLTFDISSVNDKDVLEVFINQQNMFRLIDSFSIFDYRSLGIGIKTISVE